MKDSFLSIEWCGSGSNRVVYNYIELHPVSGVQTQRVDIVAVFLHVDHSSVRFYCLLVCSVLFCYVGLFSLLIWSFLFHCVLFFSIIFCSVLFYKCSIDLCDFNKRH